MLPKLYEICAKKVRCYIHMHLVVDIPKYILCQKSLLIHKYAFGRIGGEPPIPLYSKTSGIVCMCQKCLL